MEGPGGFYIDKQLSIYIADNSDNSIVKWLKESEQGIIVAGGYGIGSNLNQFDYPVAVFVDEQDSNTLYIADFGNSRVMQWLENATEGRTIIGTTGDDAGIQLNQFPSKKMPLRLSSYKNMLSGNIGL
ncbi:unnamed protein product [Didymodactylos carnosus]|uniref:NHL repeat-containing protein n=1 Tax=Didymodactylos carnosus TaxID=1234261 RepID=A0A815U694_9BILA|nr:unnamed protein product [Didymodactylos carnosus]CAF4372590.1 unnamed protein product [Didymodactylos carnosus]